MGWPQRELARHDGAPLPAVSTCTVIPLNRIYRDTVSDDGRRKKRQRLTISPSPDIEITTSRMLTGSECMPLEWTEGKDDCRRGDLESLAPVTSEASSSEGRS
eukprot:GFYU01016587.1.p1 GENE.GFYU01016587.1~~GFYU01016587.1.p1  ORF type:complete len:103 (+),score=9.86 GFYU01016587.1:73-381(+)